MRTIEQTISDRKIKENIKIYIWIDLFAYMCMHICPKLVTILHVHTVASKYTAFLSIMIGI